MENKIKILPSRIVWNQLEIIRQMLNVLEIWARSKIILENTEETIETLRCLKLFYPCLVTTFN